MSIVLDGTTGITTPGLTNTGTETLVNLTTTGNTTLGDASTDTLNVGNGGLIKDASGNVGVGVTPSAWSPKAIQVGSWGGIQDMGGVANQIAFRGNHYYNSGDKFLNASGYANAIALDATNGILFYTSTAASTSANSSASMSQRMTLDTSGNLLVNGTTAPSSPGMSLGQIGTVRGLQGGMETTAWRIREGLSVNYAVFTTNITDAVTQDSSSLSSWRMGMGSGNANTKDNWALQRSAPGSTTFSDLMTLDASGRLGVGATSISAQLHIQNANGNSGLGTDNTGMALVESTYAANGSQANASFVAKNYYGYGQFMQWQNFGMRIGSRSTANGGAGVVTFTYGNDSAGMTLDASGNLLVGTTSSATGNTSTFQSRSTASSDFGLAVTHTSTDGNVRGLLIKSPNSSSDDGYLIIGARSTGDRFYVRTSGNVQNTNNSYGAISDVKLKENIVDATPKLEKLNQVRIVNYNLIGESHKQIGVIAQELEQVFPGMIDESPDKDAEGNDLGTTTKSVKYSVFVPMLIKALQEQQAIITQLTARITALEGA